MYIGIIPARYASTRFPGKPLAEINGKSMIQRVYEQVQKVNLLKEIVIATDDTRIYNHVESFGGQVVMTSPDHKTGTERCYEAARKYFDYSLNGDHIIINIQGDEPFIQPKQIETLIKCFYSDDAQIGTLVKRINNTDTLFSTNNAKVIINSDNKAIYFSRNPIPFMRDIDKKNWINHHTYFEHIGIYAYKYDILSQIVKLPTGKLEQAESLEQLRWLENNYSIYVEKTDIESFSIDTPEELEIAKQKFYAK